MTNRFTASEADKQLSEEDIKLRYITPAIIDKCWSVEDITMETKVKLTDGKINLRGNLVARGKAKYADYMLYYNKANPIAIVEAKDANHSVSHGMKQAKEYAEMMDIPFAYSSNGMGFQEYDFLTGHERSFAMDEFPSKDQAHARAALPTHPRLVDEPRGDHRQRDGRREVTLLHGPAAVGPWLQPRPV